MNRATKLGTKILMLIVVILISIFLSASISWCLIQIFARTPEKLLEFNVVDVFSSLFTNEYDLQIFALLLIVFSLFLVFAVLKIFNLNDFLSKTYKVTPDILIPMPVRKESNSTRVSLVAF